MTTLVPNSTIEDGIAAWVEAATGLPSHWEGQDAPRPPAPYVSMLIQVVDPVGRDAVLKTQNVLAFADIAVTAVNATTNVLTAVAHGLNTGDGPVRVTNPPGGLAAGTDYYAIRVDADHLKLAARLSLANAGTAVDITDAGPGTTKIVSTAATERHGAEITYTVSGPRRCHLTLQLFAAGAVGTSSAASMLNQCAAAARLPARAEALRAAGVGVPVCDRANVLGGPLNSAHFEPRAVMECRFTTRSEVSETGTYVEFVGVTAQVSAPLGPLGDVEVDIPEAP